ncbi:hypothetical protein AB0K60_34970 [Thermopolyspora sp. NPDC052614]|uniref:hypothetical protein n=1 Tax=Thermopolyspora sp. NPDC052614 TaxID=3155682 RepID=UPI00341A630E
MRELSTAIDLLADEDPADLPVGQVAEQLLELHWQMARLQAEIARRTCLRVPVTREPEGSRAHDGSGGRRNR